MPNPRKRPVGAHMVAGPLLGLHLVGLGPEEQHWMQCNIGGNQKQKLLCNNSWVLKMTPGTWTELDCF